jgi:hypothetical protein
MFSYSQTRLYIGLALLLAPTMVQAQEIVLSDSPVPIITSSDNSIFPESWRKAPISAQGEVLPPADRERIRTILDRATRKYPMSMLKQHLKAIYVVAELKYSGIAAAGTNSRNAVYIKVSDPAKGYTDHQLESVFHAEFSSILLRNEKQKLDEAAWRKANPEGFQYLGSGVQAVKEKKAGLTLQDEIHKQGFLVQYSMSDLENDFNGMASLIFCGGAARWKIAEAHPRLREKLELTIRFYQSLDPIFTEERFRSFSSGS